jgi:large subunit ribosomal protein L21
MFAVIKSGGKQYRVAPDDVIRIEKLAGEAGDIIELGAVLMVGGEGGLNVGAPFVSGASVAAEVLEQGQTDKVIVFKKKRRQNYRRRNGHRQHETVLRVTEILTDGKKPSKTKAAPKPAAKAAAETDAGKGKAKAAKPQAPAKAAAPKQAPAKKKTAPKKTAAKTPGTKSPGAKKAAPKKTGAAKTKKKD